MSPRYVSFNGARYSLFGKYYRRHAWKKGGPTTLQRAVWEHHNGPIPPGHEVHHKDGDTLNNAVGNLECLPMSEHQRRHALERHSRGELGPPSKAALAAAAEWHRSDEGRAWHSEHGVRTWDSRPWGECRCQNCGQPFRSPYPSRAKWCSGNCKAQALRRRRGVPEGPRRKPRTPTGKRAP